jgi:hypothetical protein
MATTSDIDRVGDKLTSQFGEAIDQAASVARDAATVARDATTVLRERAGKLADDAQEFYAELEGDTLTDKLRGVVGAHPAISLLVAAGVGYLIARSIRD